MTHEELVKEFKALLGQGLEQGAALNVLADHFNSPSHEKFEAIAREQTDDDLEIDDAPLFSRADDGCWVSAWVWVSNSEAGIVDDSEEEEG